MLRYSDFIYVYASRIYDVHLEDGQFIDNVVIKIRNDGIIEKLIQNSSPTDVHDPSLRFTGSVVTPSFVNAHTHIMDTLGKGLALGLELDDVVGTAGLKFQILNRNSRKDKRLWLQEALKELRQSGTSFFIDFREGGKEGVRLLKEALVRVSGMDAIVLGRPFSLDDLDDVCSVADGIALATPNLYDDDELSLICDVVTKQGKILATHLMESKKVVKVSLENHGKTDLERALDLLNPDIVVHLTQASPEDLNLVSSEVKLMVFCPRSNAFFGLGIPPVAWCLQSEVPFAFGSDNAMTTPLDVLAEARWLLLRLAEEHHHLFTMDTLKEFFRALVEYPPKQLETPMGRVAPGYKANFIVWNVNSPRFRPMNNFLEHLLLRSSKKDILRVFSA